MPRRQVNRTTPQSVERPTIWLPPVIDDILALVDDIKARGLIARFIEGVLVRSIDPDVAKRGTRDFL